MSNTTIEEFQNKQKISTRDGELIVKVTPEKPLSIGPHVFELTVVDEAGNSSNAVRVRVIVKDTKAPTAVLNVTDAEGRPLPENVLPFGAGFILNAKGSLDIGSGIAGYIWRIVS